MRILVACANRASFIDRDIRILSEKNEVSHFIARGLGFANIFKNFRKLRRADLLLLWFATPRSIPVALAARLLRKKVAIIIGGYEAASLPEFEYGSARNRLRAIPVKLLLRLSHGISVVSESSRRSTMNNLNISSSRIQRIYHGFDDILGSRSPSKERRVITVGTINRESWVIKGFKDFLRLAEMLPDIMFVHIGGIELDVRSMLGHEPSENVEFVGKVPYENMSQYLAPATVYLQLSHHESFGCAVAEAMLCECIPVVSSAFALPEVVGETGIILHDRELDRAAKTIIAVLESPGTMGKTARDRILKNFSVERRREQLEDWLKRL